MYPEKLVRVDRFVTPRKGLAHWAVYVRRMIVAGPFPTRELARERRRMMVGVSARPKVVQMSAPVPEPVAEHPSYNTVLNEALAEASA